MDGVPRVLIAGGIVLVALLALLWVGQRRLIYFPDPAPPPAAAVIPGAEDVELRTTDGQQLGAWFVPARGEGLGVSVLVAPGNAGNRAGRAPLAMALAERGLSVLLLDYRGYGGNGGSPSEQGLALDVRAARDHLVRERGVPPSRLIYVGESLGGAVVVELAVEHPPAGMVLRSPFTDLAAVGRQHYPWLPVRALLRDEYPVTEQLRQLDVPVSVVHGSADSVVPAEQSRDVAGAARQLVRRVEVAGADHNDRVLLDGAQLVDAVVELATRTRP